MMDTKYQKFYVRGKRGRTDLGLGQEQHKIVAQAFRKKDEERSQRTNCITKERCSCKTFWLVR